MDKRNNIFILFFMKILKLVSTEKEYESFIGDVEEFYDELISEKGWYSSTTWYIIQIIKSIGVNFPVFLIWRFTMLKNYFKIALRNIKNYKTYSFINISGLAVGLASCILVFLWLNDEMSFDKFHDNSNELYRAISITTAADQTISSARTPTGIGAALVEQYPEFINYTRYQCFEGTLIEANERSLLCNYLGVADQSIFEMFTFDFISGDSETALTEKYSIVLTESLAETFFGDEDPVGKIMNLQIRREPFKVTGVIEDLPENSHIHFDCILPFSVCYDWFHAEPAGWEPSMYYTYLQTEKGIDRESVSEKIKGIIKENDQNSLTELDIQSLKDIHLSSDLLGDMDNYKKGNIKFIYIYGFTALGILLIACINFMNLSTAKSSRRAKEVGLRKVVGARKKQLLNQFLGESVILTLVALVFSITIVRLLLPAFNSLTDKNLVFDMSMNYIIIAGCLGITLLTGLLSGVYPAFILSTLNPVKGLRDKGLKGGRGGILLRKALVITQFVLSVILIAVTLAVYDQLDYISNKPLGYEPEGIIIPGGYLFWNRNPEPVKNELLSNPDIFSISQGIPPSAELTGNNSFSWAGKNPDEVLTFYTAYVDQYYLETYGMDLVEGRFFSKEYGADLSKLVVNETAANVFGDNSPLGKVLRYRIQDFDTGEFNIFEGEVIGVLKDYHQGSLHNEIEPTVFIHSRGHPYTSIKYNEDKTADVLKFIEQIWGKYVDYPYTYTLLNETIENFYTNDRKTGKVFMSFALLAIFISCLGLFGLTSYTTEQRKKEIGIRKVLGTSNSGITFLLFREFFVGLAVSLVLACPIAWVIMRKWLESFAYRIDPGIVTLLTACFLATITVLISISIQLIKAAGANPVDTLKYE